MGVAHAWRRPGAPIIIVRRLLKFSGVPVVVDEIYLPGEIFQGSPRTAAELEWLLCTVSSSPDSGLRMIRAQERIRAVAADRTTAEMLRVGESRRFFRWSG